MSLAEQAETGRCASCGKSGAVKAVAELDNAPLCVSCVGRVSSEKAISYWAPAEEGPPPPSEERFSELFRAARTLLQEGTADENVIYPTLALAHAVRYYVDLAELKARIVYEWDSPETRKSGARVLTQRCNEGLWPVGRGGEGSLLVKQATTAGRVEYYRSTEVPEQVDLMVFPHRAPEGTRTNDYAADCAVASYKEAMSVAGIPHDDGSGQGPVDSYFESGVMHVTIRHCEWPLEQAEDAPIVFSDRMPVFPHPALVRNLCLAYLKGPNGSGFLRFLKPGKSGRDNDPWNLIPGCVTALLREDGDLPWSSVRQLLNQQKIYDLHRGPFPEDELDEHYESRKKQLERSARRARKRLLPIMAATLQGPL